MKKVNWRYLIDTLLFISIIGTVIIGLLMAFVIPGGPSAPSSAKYFLGLHRHAWGDIHLYFGISFTVLAVIHLVLGWNWIKGKTRGVFGSRWKTALTAVCALPFLVLTILWWASPGETVVNQRRGTENVRLQQKVPESGQYPVQKAAGTVSRSSPGVEKSIPPQHKSSETGDDSEEEIAGKKEESSHHHHDEEAGLTRGRGSEDTTAILVTGQMTLRDIERQTGISAAVLLNRLGLPQGISPDERLGRLRRRYQFTMQEVRDTISSILEAK